VEVDENCLSELVKACEKNECIGICGSKVKNLGTNEIQNAGDFINIFGILKHRGMNQEDRGQLERVKEVFSVPSCSMLVKRDLLDKMGFWFDSKFFIYFEDTEFCWRARLLGFRVLYVPHSVIYHRSKKMSDINPKSIYFTYRNRIWSFRRNFRVPLKQIFLFSNFLTISLGVILWTLKGKWSYGLDIFKHFFDEIKKMDLSKIALKDQLRALSPKLI
jgi:hypothetical protein